MDKQNSQIDKIARINYMEEKIRVCEECKSFFASDEDADDHSYCSGHTTVAYFKYELYNYEW